MEEEVKKILTNLVLNNKEIPVAHLRYYGKNKTYVIWTLLSEEPTFASDDEIQYTTVNVDVDIYSDSNYLNVMKLIKTKFKENEWTWIEDSIEMYEENTELYHRTCTFSKERKI